MSEILSDILAGVNRAYSENIYHVARTIRPVSVLEIGMFHGDGAEAILRGMHDAEVSGRLIDIEISPQSGAIARVERVANECGQQWELIPLGSASAKDSLTQTTFDLVYIDADHSFDSTLLEWNTYGPMGRFVMFDDLQYDGVGQVFRSIVESGGYDSIEWSVGGGWQHQGLVTKHA